MGENPENTVEMSEKEKFALSRISESPLRINKALGELDLPAKDEVDATS